MSSTASAHHVGHRGDFVARGVNGDEESGETLVALLGGIGHSDDVSEFAAVGVRDDQLLAVEDVVAILVLLSGGVDAAPVPPDCSVRAKQVKMVLSWNLSMYWALSSSEP